MPLIIPPYIPEGYEQEVVDLDSGEMRSVLIGKSVRLWWEHGVPCPCRSTRTLNGRKGVTGEPQENCAYCGGAGTMYVNGQQIVGMRTSTSESQRLHTEYGPYAKGTMWLTLLPEHVADHLDRYTLLDGVRTHGELRKRKGTVEKLRYPVIKRTFVCGTPEDRGVQQELTVGVQFCMASDSDGVVTGVELIEDTDFVVDDDGKLDWTLGDDAGTAPAVGEYYTVRYYARPRFVLDDHVYLSRDLYQHADGVVCLTPNPVRALLALDFLGGVPPVSEDNPQPTSDME